LWTGRTRIEYEARETLDDGWGDIVIVNCVFAFSGNFDKGIQVSRRSEENVSVSFTV
jgi:hypothetical protein